MNEQPDLSILQSAARASVHPSTIIRAISSGSLHAVKRFRKWRVSQLELARWLDAVSEDRSRPAARHARTES